jgi:hypothetical protein
MQSFVCSILPLLAMTEFPPPQPPKSPPPGYFFIDTVEAALAKLDIDISIEHLSSVIREIEASKVEQYYEAWEVLRRKSLASLHSPISYP